MWLEVRFSGEDDEDVEARATPGGDRGAVAGDAEGLGAAANRAREAMSKQVPANLSLEVGRRSAPGPVLVECIASTSAQKKSPRHPSLAPGAFDR
ncbi:hypothetical protein FA04_11735 [Ensifer adhaerens]|nr:hypothetical protein FA04_11735 [Ensifer adhaerens]KDP71196.1 hypothetical protein FA04_24215 [Ensifer adhaerens]KQX32397.1 hypothetical protein ASD01_00070 [Ensifer sp. Root423]KQZ57961.1 hypothetical protein ASD63_00075 [Ensifer sp. Root558]